MLKVEELRVGNNIRLLQDNSIVAVTVDIMADSLIHYRPVQITSEILIKCGFAANGMEYKLDSVILYNLSQLGYVLVKSNDESPPIQMNYLHQLQNFYYAVTQKELAFYNEVT